MKIPGLGDGDPFVDLNRPKVRGRFGASQESRWELDPQPPLERILELLGAVKSTGDGLAELAAALARHEPPAPLEIPTSE